MVLSYRYSPPRIQKVNPYFGMVPPVTTAQGQNIHDLLFLGPKYHQYTLNYSLASDAHQSIIVVMARVRVMPVRDMITAASCHYYLVYVNRGLRIA